MNNRAIDTLVIATGDSFKNFKKILGSTALATTLVATSFFAGSPSADAADLTVNNGQTIVLAGIDQANKDDNLIFGTATTGIVNTAATIMNVVNGSSANGNSAIAIAGTGSLIFSGNITSTDQLVMTVGTGADVFIAGNTTGGEPLKFVTAGAGGVTLNGASTQTLEGIFDSDSSLGGRLVLSGVGVKTFAEAVGGANAHGAITTSAGSTGIFASTTEGVIFNNLGTTTLTGAATITTLNNAGALTVTAAIDKVSGGLTTINMTAQGSSVLFNATDAVDLDMIVKTATDSFGTLNFIDSADAGPVANTLSGGDIGETTKRIGTINIGSATKGGNLTTLDGDAIFAAAINVTGGNVDTENSLLGIHESIGDADSLAAIVLTDNAGDAELNILTGSSVFGTIDGTAGAVGAGDSIIDVDTALTVTGSIGGTNAVDLLQIGDTTTLSGAVNTITSSLFTADDLLNIGITANAVAQTFDSVITTATTETGTLSVVNAAKVVTFEKAIGTDAVRLKNIAIADNATTRFKSAISTLALDINTAAAEDVTTWTIGNIVGDKDATAGTMNIAGGTFVLDTAAVSGTTVFNATESNNNDDGVELRALVVQPSANFTNGTMTFIDGATATSIDAQDVLGISVTDTALTDFTVGITAGVADVTISASAKSAASVAKSLGITSDQGRAAANIMEAAILADTTLMNTLNESLTGVNSGVLKTTTDLAVQAAPQTDTIGGSATSTRAMTGTVQGIVSNRMASLRSGDAFVTGMSAGNGMSANSGFIQAFGSEAEQKNTSNQGATVFGFDSETAGLAVGFDGMTESGSTIGLSASFSSTDVSGKGTGKAINDIDSYTVSVYADKATNNGYIEGSLTYGINDNTASRIVNTAGLNRAYTAAYDSSQLSLKISAGSPTEVSVDTYITPFGSFTSSSISTDSYIEKSVTASDNLRLKVDQDDISSMVGTLGIKAHKVTDNGTPMISFAVNNEFGDTKIKSTNTYQGGGTAFKTTSDIEALSATLGLGYSFGSEITSLNISYETEWNDEDYTSAYGSIKITSKF